MGDAYAEAVASGKMPTNKWLQLAAQRYLKMREMAEQPGNAFYFSPLHVIDYCEFAEKLRHFEGGSWEITQANDDGTVNDHIILEPFEIWMESCIQGFRTRMGTRLVETALELIPRKNAKSLRATRAALFELCCSNERAPQIPIAAATEKQAEQTLFGDILAMVKNEPELVEHYKLHVTTKEIRRGDGVIFMLSSQGERQDGLNPSLALFEEGHAGAASVYKVVDSAFGARPNAQRRMITTAGYKPEGPAHELMLQVQMMLRGDIEDYTLFGAIYTLDNEDFKNPETNAIDWDTLLTEEGLIARCNPMYGVGLDPVKIRAAVVQAHKARIDKRGEQARTRFNIWTGAGQTLIDESEWAGCKRDNLTLEDFIGEKCWIGVDLAQVKDMCAIALLFELPNDHIVVFVKYFLPELSETASHPELVDHIMNWDDQDLIKLTPGPLADHDLVRQDVEMFCEVFDVQVIACDPAQAHNTVKHLWDGSKPVMTYPNSGATMTPPTDDILGRISVQSILHDGNPMLAWNVRNVHGERKENGTILPRKDKPGSIHKIDGFVAICFANGCRLNPELAKPLGEETKEDPYLRRGLIGYQEEFAE